MSKVCIYTDGGCSGNPGPGGWAAVILIDEDETIVSGGERGTTNNRMELTAVIRALEKASGMGVAKGSIDVYTDSQYVKKGISEWIKIWVKNGWKNSAKDPVKNRDLWQKLLDVSAGAEISWHWVKGHASNPFNNRCDALVQTEIRKLK